MVRKGFRLIMAIVTIAAFLSTSLYAGPEPVRFKASPGEFDIEALTLPAGLGETSSVFKGTNGKTILHIQDAHCNYNAQHSIAGIVSNLSDNYNASLVFLEGGAGSYDFSAFDRIKDPSIKEKVSDYFVKEGIVTGAEFFAINNPQKAELYGIEDESLYFKNLKVYRDSLAFRKEADSYLKTLSQAMDNLKLKVYSPALKEFDEKISAHREHKISFKAYAVYLKEKAEVNSVAIADYKNLSNLFITLRIESAINFKGAEKERDLLMDKLESVLPKSGLEKLGKMFAEYKAGEMPSEAFYGYLFREAKIAKADLKTLPNLVKYSEYLKAYESIDKAALLKEVKDVEGLIAGKLAKTEDQRKIYRLDKDLNILKSIFNTSLIKEDFDYYSAHKDDFDVKNFTGFFIKRGPAYGLKFTPDDKLNKLDIYRNEMEKFYEYSLKRDDAFLKNIEAKLAADKKNIAILITGGFHSANLFKLFKDKGYSYAKVMPKFKADQGDNPYFNLLAGGMTPMQEFLKTAVSYTPEKAMLAIETPFSQMPVPTLVKNIIGLEIDMLPQLMANKVFTIQTKAGYIVVSPDAYVEGALGKFEIKSGALTFYASTFTTPGSFTVNAVLLDNESMNWSRAAGIIEGAPGQGPQVPGERKEAAAPRYAQVVSVIRGAVGEGFGPQYAGEQIIKAGGTEKIEGAPGAPFRVVLRSALVNGQKSLEGPPTLEAGNKSNKFSGLPEEMAAFEKIVMQKLEGKEIFTDRPVMINYLYNEVPIEMLAAFQSVNTQDNNALKNTVFTRRVGNVEFNILPNTEAGRNILGSKIDGFASINGIKPDDRTKRIVTFAYQTPKGERFKTLEDSSYTVYFTGKEGYTAYAPVRTCGMTGLAIMYYYALIDQAAPRSDLNYSVDLIARGIGALSGIPDYKDIIGLIASMDAQGRLELLKSGMILVRIRPVDITQIKLLHDMAEMVRKAA